VLRAGLNAHYVAVGASNAPTEVRTADVALTDLVEVNEALLELMELLEPHGSGNPRPLWALQGLRVEQATTMGREKSHLRLRLRDEAGHVVAAVGFGLAGRYAGLEPGRRVTVVGELNKNEYQGKSTLQVVMKEIRYE
jgi:single-stranded-DNA-specific exonuclease